MNNQKTALYRHYNIDNQLLYVGISLSAPERFIAHKQTSLWADDMVRMEVEYFYNRKDAIAAEKLAIKTEKPLHNIIHNPVKPKYKKDSTVKNKEITEDNYPYFRVACGIEESTGEVFVCMTDKIINAMIIDNKRTFAIVMNAVYEFQDKLLKDPGFKKTLKRVYE